MGIENKYDVWHEKHISDDDISTPWHNYVKSSLSAEDVNGKNILEIGCGRGGFSRYLINNFPDIRGLYSCDYSTSALDIARETTKQFANIQWLKEDIQNLSFESDYFDTIISCETIEHVPHPRKALGELSRVLKKGGKLILTCPNYFNPFGIWCAYRLAIGKPFTEGGQPYVNYLQVPSIYSKLIGLGLKVDDFRTTELIIPNKRPKTLYPAGIPWPLKIFGFRTFYVLTK